MAVVAIKVNFPDGYEPLDRNAVHQPSVLWHKQIEIGKPENRLDEVSIGRIRVRAHKATPEPQ